MPATPRSPKSIAARKVHVTPLQNRPKGAVRAKSGCYTCRIRRKKCDERRIGDESGPCETCIRLKLECLGFGAKRPDWLRESHKVAQIRDRIKAHLAAQGMIKGHAGSGARIPLQDEILRLSDPSLDHEIPRGGGYQSGTSSSAGSPAREDSVESDRHYQHHQHRIAPYHQHRPSYSFHHHHYGGDYNQDVMSSRCDSPSDMNHPYEFPDANADMPNYSLQTIYQNPAKKSIFGPHYHTLWTIEQEPDPDIGPEDPSPTVIRPSQYLPFECVNQSMKDYVDNVVKIQYLLGDNLTLPEMIWQAVNTHQASQEAVRLLSSTYYSRNHDPNQRVVDGQTVAIRIDHLRSTLYATPIFTSDDAMAALHVVSVYLFDGGKGPWLDFLTLACTYAARVLDHPRYFRVYSNALESASPKDAFVIKTAIWFDVIASITTQQAPILIQYIRELFKPNQSFVGSPPTYTMMSPMGCENVVVWALAEASELSCWKSRHERMGDLSIRELVRRASEIEPYLQAGPQPIKPCDSPESWARYFASEIFRTSTKLFLKSVEAGDFPNVSEIKYCVQDVVNCLQETFSRIHLINSQVELVSAVIRSTVFGIYLCASLAEEPVMHGLEVMLQQHSGNEGVGNCLSVSQLLQDLQWHRANSSPSNPVPWRRLLAQQKMLLV
ncbi:hypothetical protein CPB83DRAFT_846832 [Crepidotus variabilis]|uniref:Zn(2)-C6 fungal-type domain-containing protein n=1 Tax=Crepidotus variabilis TaxID=179855 RepID=A0A9P6EPT0_9AGAR|nr:hypothetical protein CPB83DRAFT_846832 [Crepidotus variabilis]